MGAAPQLWVVEQLAAGFRYGVIDDAERKVKFNAARRVVRAPELERLLTDVAALPCRCRRRRPSSAGNFCPPSRVPSTWTLLTRTSARWWHSGKSKNFFAATRVCLAPGGNNISARPRQVVASVVEATRCWCGPGSGRSDWRPRQASAALCIVVRIELSAVNMRRCG